MLSVNATPTSSMHRSQCVNQGVFQDSARSNPAHGMNSSVKIEVKP